MWVVNPCHAPSCSTSRWPFSLWIAQPNPYGFVLPSLSRTGVHISLRLDFFSNCSVSRALQLCIECLGQTPEYPGDCATGRRTCERDGQRLQLVMDRECAERNYASIMRFRTA